MNLYHLEINFKSCSYVEIRVVAQLLHRKIVSLHLTVLCGGQNVLLEGEHLPVERFECD